MIPIPYQQVDEFLSWLNEHHPTPEPASGTGVKEVLLEYLKTKGRVGALNPAYALRVFQTCPMMYEPSVRDQMTHFVGCGGCLHYIRERYKQYPRWLELHPLLEGFLQFCQQSQWGEILEKGVPDFDSDWTGEGPEYVDHLFREYAHRLGPNLVRAFDEYLQVADPALIRDYEAYRTQKPEVPPRTSKPSREWTEPLAISEGLEQAAERLLGSVYLLIEGRFYKEAREDPEVYRRLVDIGLLSQQAARGIEFFSWLQERYPDLDLYGSVPVEGVVELVLDFCEEKGYTDAKSFSQEVLKWIRGDPEHLVLRRLTSTEVRSKRESDKRPSGPELAGGEAVHYEAMFLFHSSGAFPGFIKRYWKDLNQLSKHQNFHLELVLELF